MEVFCDVCDKICPSYKSLRRHLLKYHDRAYSSPAGVSVPYPPARLKAAKAALLRDRVNPAGRQKRRDEAAGIKPSSSRKRGCAKRRVDGEHSRSPHRSTNPAPSSSSVELDGAARPSLRHSRQSRAPDRTSARSDGSARSTKRSTSHARKSPSAAVGSSGCRDGATRPTRRSPSSTAQSKPDGATRPTPGGHRRPSAAREPAAPSTSFGRERPSAAAGSEAQARAVHVSPTRRPTNYIPAGSESTDSDISVFAADLSDGAVIDDFFNDLCQTSYGELHNPTAAAAPPSRPSTSSASNAKTTKQRSTGLRPPKGAGDGGLPSGGNTESMPPPSSPSASAAHDVPQPPLPSVPVEQALPLLDVCPISYEEIAAAVEASSQHSASVIVASFTARRVLSPRGLALLQAAVGAAVATHRWQATLLIRQANTAFAAGDTSHLIEDITLRLETAAARPFDAHMNC